MSLAWILGLSIGGGFVALVGLVALYDLFQKQHAILRNFPIVGHFRYWLEAIGPELSPLPARASPGNAGAGGSTT